MLFQYVFVSFGTFFKSYATKKVAYETNCKDKMFFENQKKILYLKKCKYFYEKFHV